MATVLLEAHFTGLEMHRLKVWIRLLATDITARVDHQRMRSAVVGGEIETDHLTSSCRRRSRQNPAHFKSGQSCHQSNRTRCYRRRWRQTIRIFSETAGEPFNTGLTPQQPAETGLATGVFGIEGWTQPELASTGTHQQPPATCLVKQRVEVIQVGIEVVIAHHNNQISVGVIGDDLQACLSKSLLQHLRHSFIPTAAKQVQGNLRCTDQPHRLLGIHAKL